MLECFLPQTSQTRVGIVRYSSAVTIQQHLGRFDNYCDFAADVRATPYDSLSTATSAGIVAATSQFRSKGRPRSLAVPRVMLVVTDGASNQGCLTPAPPAIAGLDCFQASTIHAANLAREQGITVMAVAVGPDVNYREILAIAGGNSRYVFNVTNYQSLLGSIIATIQEASCREPARASLDIVVNRTLNGNQSVYLQYNNVTGPLNLNLTVTGGDVRMCISYSARNPSSADGRNDGCAGVGDPTGSTVITGFPPAGNTTIYVVCEGAGGDGNSSSFLLSAGTCASYRANVTAGGSGVTDTNGGGFSVNNATNYLVTVAIPSRSASATPAPRCFSCPDNKVMLATTGELAGVCADRCASDREWTWNNGRRLCFPCHVSCYQCGPAGGVRDCRSCNDGFALLHNAIDATAPGGAWAAGSGRCVAPGSCPNGTSSAFGPGWFGQRCVTVTPSPSATVTPSSSASGTRTPSPSGTGSVTATATSTVTSSATATNTGTSTATVTNSGTSTMTGSMTATMTSSMTATSSVTGSATATMTATGSATASSTAAVTATRTHDASPSRSPGPLRTNCPTAGGALCGGHGVCRLDANASSAVADVSRCYCEPGYAGAACNQCVAGFYFTATCTGCEGGTSGPCRSLIDGDPLCYGFLAGTVTCPAYMRACTEPAGYFSAALTCSSCPGSRWDARTGAVVPGSTCSGHGSCAGGGGGLCECDPGYTGEDCSERVPAPLPADPCATQLCNGRGACDGGICYCQLGWFGRNCSQYLAGLPSAANETCGGGASAVVSGISGGARRLTGSGATATPSGSPLPALTGQPVAPCNSSSAATLYGWFTGPWFRCTAFCGPNGTMTREVSCRPLVGLGAGSGAVAGDGTVSSGVSLGGVLGSDGSGSVYEYDMTRTVSESLCGGADLRPLDAAPCNRYACPVPITNASTAPALLFLDFATVLASPVFAPGTAARAAFLSAVTLELASLLGRLGFPSAVSVTSAAGVTLNVSLAPASMVWVDFEGNGTSVMVQLLSSAAVRAANAVGVVVNGSSTGNRLLRRLQSAGSDDVSPSAVAAQIASTLSSPVGVVLTAGMRYLPQAGGARWVTMNTANMPGYDPSKLLKAAPAQARHWTQDPSSVGGLAAGVTIGAAILVAAALLVHRRHVRAAEDRAKERGVPELPGGKQPTYFDMVNPGLKHILPASAVEQQQPEVPPGPRAGKATILNMGSSMRGGSMGSGGGFGSSDMGHSSRKLGAAPTRSRKAAFEPVAEEGNEDGSARRFSIRSRGAAAAADVPLGFGTSAATGSAAAAEDEGAAGGRPPLQRQGSRFLSGNPMLGSMRGLVASMRAPSSRHMAIDVLPEAT